MSTIVGVTYAAVPPEEPQEPEAKPEAAVPPEEPQEPEAKPEKAAPKRKGAK